MPAPRIFPRKLEICFHTMLVFYLVVLQWDALREMSKKHRDFLPLRGAIDLTDTQWKDFRNGLPTLAVGMVVFVTLSRLARAFLNSKLHMVFYALCGIGFVGFVHGAYAVFPLSFGLIFFTASHLFKHVPYGKVFLWILAIFLLYVPDSNSGWYKIELPFYPDLFRTYQGLYRWHVGWNITTLKTLSFGLDLIEAHKKTGGIPHKPCKECIGPAEGECYTVRVNTPRAVGEYSLINFFAYVFYIPLYIAGPITTFNGFVSHAEKPQKTYSTRYILFYVWRFLVVFMMLEVGLRYVYVWALAKSPLVRRILTPIEFAMIGFWLLNALWLKFAVIWRFFRLASLCDGVEVLENMARCVNDNYTIAGFWRNWHRSFNKWLVRYMYIPMGGAKTQAFNVFPIFLFVAFWHDLELNLLKWGLLMAVFIIPETFLTSYFSSPATAWLRAKPYYRYIKAVAGTVNITILMTANLIGFGVGSHTHNLLESVSSLWWVMGLGFVEFFSATCIMIEVREWEAEQEERVKVS
eukprot:TRINITY_DN6193_c3_g1_i1.p1 TRINITY_DN6193_c3_g1~~TRINITY_DN6193_c3_g1_i1.p1  ORF type:complete len:536 (+),score=80.42 TRINITY_DN6193_c3_g1_i1:46-1608(+)